MRSVVLETERLALCRWAADDLGAVLALHARPETVRYLPLGKPWTNAQARDHLAGWIDDYETRGVAKLKLLRREDGAFIGRAGFGWMEEMGDFELGYTIAPEFQGSGYATEIAGALARWFLRSGPRDRFIAIAHVDNAPSFRVMERIGMRYARSQTVQSLPCHIYEMSARDLRD
jgi:[ribosomal protein S5]-alanine N-acetyltransferase